jgi:hypothetical protein
MLLLLIDLIKLLDQIIADYLSWNHIKKHHHHHHPGTCPKASTHQCHTKKEKKQHEIRTPPQKKI